jgi:site-specific DNA recombinase
VNAVLYARVSDPSAQDSEDKVSIAQQLTDMRALCERNGWHIEGEFVDNESYRAKQPPKKGKIVNPSGERADRPQFLAMLKVVRTGRVDAALCWRDDRMVRHPRVAVALEDTLDIGDIARNGKPKIQIFDATGAIIDRFTLSIKATIWREENKRRAERTRMGKQATLEQGRWPGEFRRYGYKSIREPGKRGRKILLDPEMAPVVRRIFEMYDSGMRVAEIRQWLMAQDVPQIYTSMVKHEWSMSLIGRILRQVEYLGKATWRFNDGKTFELDIPPIIEPALWHRVQDRIDRNKQLSTRNAQGIYLLQGIAYCADCGNRFSVSTPRTKTLWTRHFYRCHTAGSNAHEPHPRPYGCSGPGLDFAVWRHLVDYGIKRPDLIREQVEARQAELREQGSDMDSEIARARRKLDQLDQQRAFYQRQAARGKMTEAEFDARMDETGEEQRYWQNEIAGMLELRDDVQRVDAGLDYATKLLAEFQERLTDINHTVDELKALPKEERNVVLKARRDIIRALCDKVYVDSEKHVRIEGVLDGSEAAQFNLQGSY